MKDEIHQGDQPTKEFYTIYENKDGTKSYYKNDMEFLYRWRALYGNYSGKWSYTRHDADKVFE